MAALDLEPLVSRLRQDYLAIGDHWSLHREAADAIERQRKALCEIKRTALTATNGAGGLAHIVRVCIDAGISENLPDLVSG